MSNFIEQNFLRQCGVEVTLQLGLGIIMGKSLSKGIFGDNILILLLLPEEPYE